MLWLMLTAGLAGSGALDGTVSPGTRALEWRTLAPLPDALGVGGPFVARLESPDGELLLVAGGANFPGGPPWEGGAKVWHDAAWIFDGDTWRAGPPLPEPRAYGAVVQVDGAAWLIGGGDGETASREVLIARVEAGGEVVYAPGPQLPEPSQYLAAQLVGDRIVVLAAQRGVDPLDSEPATFVLDPGAPAPTWERAAPFPGAARLKTVTAVQTGADGEPAMFVISGEVPGLAPVSSVGGAEFLPTSDEVWSYVPAGDLWTQHAPLPGPGPAALFPGRAAGVAFPIGQSQILVSAGVDAVPLDVPIAEREPFSGSWALYHTITDTWALGVEDAMPSGVVTTGLAPWADGFVVVSGEVRPGVRTNEVQFGRAVRDAAPLALLDHGVMLAYLAALVALGVYFSRRERTPEDFFLAGHRIPWWAAGLSIYATQLSAITYVAIPAKAFVEDWVFALTSLTILAMAPIVVVFYLPFYRRLGVQTAYEYLERRFSLGIRLFGSASFMAFQVARMAIVVFLPSLALSTVTGVDVYLCIATIGLLATAYTVLGGFEAVVWTDVLQVVILIGGLGAALVLAIHGAGGVGEALEVARSAEKLRWFEGGTSWTDTASWSVLIGAMFLQLGPYTTDQAVVQRYLATRDERGAARGIWLNGLIAVPFTFAFFALGSALFAYFSANPKALAPGMKNDEIFPLFIALELPAGLAGLVLAGIFAASMSSLDSSMHAIATAWTNDWYGRLRLGVTDPLRVGRRVTLLMGLVGTGAAAAMAAADLRSLYDAFQSVLGLLTSPLAGLFVLGIFTRRTSAAGAAIGAAAAVGVLAWVQNATTLNFMLYGALGTTTCVTIGYAASLALPNRRETLGLTWWSRHGTAGRVAPGPS